MDNRALPLWCGDAGCFWEGLAVAEDRGKWFHVLASGEPAYEERFEKVEYFQQGRAWAKKNGKWIIIDRQGKEIPMKNTSSPI